MLGLERLLRLVGSRFLRLVGSRLLWLGGGSWLWFVFGLCLAWLLLFLLVGLSLLETLILAAPCLLNVLLPPLLYLGVLHSNG